MSSRGWQLISLRDMKIRTRLVLSVSVCSILGIGIILAIVGSITARSAEENARIIAEETARTYRNIIKTRLEEPLYESRRLAQLFEAATTSLTRRINRKDAETLLKSFAESGGYGVGYFVRFEPNGFDGLDARYGNSQGYDETGRFSSYWIRGEDGKGRRFPLKTYRVTSIEDPYQIPRERVDEYYELPKKRLNECIIEPYTNPIFGKDVLLVTLAHPIFDRLLRFVGVAGVDIPLAAFQKTLGGLKVGHFREAYAILYSQGGTIAGTSRNPELLGRNIVAIFKDDAMINRVLVGDPFFMKRRSDRTGTRVFTYGAPIEIGKTETSWTVAVNIPEKEVFVEVHRLVAVMFTIGLLVTLFIVGAVWVISGAIARPIDDMKRVFRVVAQGNLDEPIDTTRKDELGSLAQSFSHMRDEIRAKIARIMESDKELRKSEEKYRSIFENAVEGIFQSTPEGGLISVNPAMARIYGYDAPEEMVADILNIPAQIYVNPEERDFYRKIIEERGTIRNFEHQSYRKDGTIIWVAVNSRAVRDPQGGIVYYEGTLTDITRRKQAEEALREEQEKLRIASENARAIVSATTDAICLCDRNGVILDINEAGAVRLNVDFNTAVKTSILAGVSPDVEERRRSRLLTVGAAKKPLYYESEEKGRWFDTCLYPVISDGEVTGFVSYGRDITERKRVEMALQASHNELERRVIERTAKLEEANKDLEAFAYSVSHDLRAPLRHIAGFIGLLVKRVEGQVDEISTHYLTAIAESSHKMGRLIDDLLAHAGVGRAEVSHRPVRLDTLVMEVRQEMADDLRGRKVAWRVDSLPVVNGDPGLLRQALFNLLSNAAKFTSTREEAVIEIGVLPKEQDVGGKSKETTIFVRDNGVGFDPQYSHKLFGVFQRLHKETEFPGTGIGLAIVQRVISRHGGRVWAEGAVGRGATFYFTVAAAKEA